MYKPHKKKKGTYGTAGPTTGGLNGPQAHAPTPAPVTPDVGGPDWQEQAYEAQAARGVQFADAQATYDTGRINRDFGYGADGTVDPNNPYSKAALLEKMHAANARGVTNSAAASGNLYAGSTQNAKNSELFGYLSQSNTLKNQYSDAQGQVALNQLGSYTSAGNGVSQDAINALIRRLQGG